MSETFLTAEGAAKLKAELHELTTVKRVELAARLRDAIKMGDLSENADYIMAKEDQAFLEGRIQELEAILRSATIIDNHDSVEGVVSMGKTVTVQEKGEDPETFTLVPAKSPMNHRWAKRCWARKWGRRLRPRRRRASFNSRLSRWNNVGTKHS